MTIYPARMLLGALIGTAALLGTANAASANGDSGEACRGTSGVEGATQGRYGAGAPWVTTGDPVPYIHHGQALTGVGGDGWNRPLGQVPECPTASTTTTAPAATTTTSATAATTTSTSARQTTTTAVPRRAVTSSTISATSRPATTTTVAAVDPGELPRTGADGRGALAAVGLVGLGTATVFVARRPSRKAH